MNVTVCMPWRPQPDRLAAHGRVLDFWAYHGFEVVHGDGPRNRKFNLSAARNAAVRQADSDMVIVADADTIPDIAAVRRALTHTDGVTWPFNTYRHICPSFVDHPDLLAAPVVHQYSASVGGILVCRRDTYWLLGGMDERFIGWGFEDNAFYLVARTLASVRRVPGVVFSFNHSAERDMSPTNPNRVLYEQYRTFAHRPIALREFINGHTRRTPLIGDFSQGY